MGRLTKEPTYGTSANGTAYARWSIAVDRRYSRNNQDQQADFFNISTFNKGADFVRDYLHKGTKVVVSGEMRNDNYQDKQTGKTVYGFVVVSDSIEFAESKKASQGNAAQPYAQAPQAAAPQYGAPQQAPAQPQYQQPAAAAPQYGAPQQAPQYQQPAQSSVGAFPGTAPQTPQAADPGDEFMTIPEGIDSELMPFN